MKKLFLLMFTTTAFASCKKCMVCTIDDPSWQAKQELCQDDIHEGNTFRGVRKSLEDVGYDCEVGYE